MDRDTGEPLYGANVMVKQTVLGAAADTEGRFRIINLPPGVYQIEASMMGYKKEVKEVNITQSGDIPTLLFHLEPTVLQNPALLVTASKRKQHIEDAPTSVDIVSISAIRMRSAVNLGVLKLIYRSLYNCPVDPDLGDRKVPVRNVELNSRGVRYGRNLVAAVNAFVV